MITVTREHSISCGHRVYEHEGKCKDPHGHNYKFEMTFCRHELDDIGRVIDFGIIKQIFCDWLERNWDHKTLLYRVDPLFDLLVKHCSDVIDPRSLVPLPVNPTAENMAKYLVDVIAPSLLFGTDVTLIKCVVHETDKCSACYELNSYAIKERVNNAEDAVRHE